MTFRIVTPLLPALLFCLSVSPAGAQNSAGHAAAPAASGGWITPFAFGGPRTTRIAAPRERIAGFHRHTVDLLVQQRRRARAPGTVLMIVGGTVAAVGIVTDESLLIVGGTAVGAYGLYLYLR